MSIVAEGSVVKVHYTGMFSDGVKFDSSRDRDEPISFTVGSGDMIEGFENSVVGMSQGQVKTITLKPDVAYGEHKKELFKVVTADEVPEGFTPEEGLFIKGERMDGTEIVGKITEVYGGDRGFMVDFNHPLAGKTLEFEIEVVEVS